MKSLRKLLEDVYNEGEEACDSLLHEILTECCPIEWEGDYEEHRWRTEYDQVRSVSDEGVTRYFRHSNYYSNSDNDAEGCGYCFEGIDNVVEVFPKEVTVIEFVTKNN